VKVERKLKLGAGSVLAFASLATVLYVFVLDLERTSPGPLSAAHAGDARLEGGQRCDACHGARGQAMAGACGACHAAVAESLAGAPGFHAALGAVDAADCGLCHREHLGAGLALVDDLGFELAGFASRDDYDHRGLAFAPSGKHAELECARCHAHADALRLPPDAGRFHGLEASCGSCHDDPHAGRMAQACADCHDQAHAFDDFSSFRHQSDFALEGSHAGLSCTACHARDGEHAVELLAGPGPHPPARACADCHASPHDAGFLARAAELVPAAGRKNDGGATCASCHDARDAGFRGAVECPKALHEATGFSLAAPHDRAECAACHGVPAGGDAAAFAARFPGRRASDCAACHDDPHQGGFDGRGFAADGCASCHAPHGFLPATFDAERHGLTAFGLTGRHAGAECAACHALPAGNAPGARVFGGTPQDCAACHADAHEGTAAGAAWRALWSGPGRTSAEGCAVCHTTDAFGDDHARGFDHGRWTGLALEGAHARAACEACHPPLAAPEPSGRTFGRAAERFGAVERCSSCHADPHVDAAWQREAPAPDCSACHTVESFAGEEARRFEHGRWTGFALTGRHQAAACAACHGPASVLTERRLGRVAERFPGPVSTCATCHADPHGAAFASDDATSCARCHTTLGFELPAVAFEHAWTGYALEGPHARVACAGCHAPYPGGGPEPETGRRFAPARGTRCADCHADPHVGQFGDSRKDARADCARCHAGAAALRFDHDDSRFPLDARHAKLACAACHKPWPLPGGPDAGTAVRYRPLGITCKDCHGTAREGR
jgi:hypothetical protein